MQDELFGKRIVILGLARQGTALAKFAARAGAIVVVSDLKGPELLKNAFEELTDLDVEYVLGEHPESLLEDADVLAISGGVSAKHPLVNEARHRGIMVTNDSLEFLKRAKTKVIGITGSAGKTTTTALTGEIIRASGRTTWTGGNIGRPLIAELHKMKKDDVAIQELSSFQLDLWTRSPQIAAILNITPNHLDRHQTMEAYSAAKSNIVRYQDTDDIAVLPADNQGLASIRRAVKSRLREFSLELTVEDGAFIRNGKIWLRDGTREKFVLDLEVIPIRGWHNVLNVLASAVLADSIGVKPHTIQKAVSTFSGVEHRLETVRVIDGVQYINDSIATAPERAIAAVKSFSEPIILLAGGRDKDMVWDEWARQVLQRVRVVILFGELADFLEMFLTETSIESLEGEVPEIDRVKNMEEAVALATRVAQRGDIVLLSPGGTSFDAFADFEERGRLFRRLVNEIAGARASKVLID